MQRLETDVLVIGGGCTGVGIVRDLALRGIDCTLVERSDLATGTTGRFHGLLHSGGRYVVSDPVSARECVEENAILRRIAADCIEDTGGLFVSTRHDDAAFADAFLDGCRSVDLPVTELAPAAALRREPRLDPRIDRVFEVGDAAIDAWKLVGANARDAVAHGARVATYRRVVRLTVADGAVTGAVVCDPDGVESEIGARLVVNAAGAWARQITAMAGCHVDVVGGRGIMIALAHRLVHTVINRCAPPGDGDILVPIRTVCVIGTTDVLTDDPDDQSIPAAEVAAMLDDGEKLVPGLRAARALRVWAGVRPLYHPPGEEQATAEMSREFALIDHAERDGVGGLLTISGGKLTTYRMMAEVTVDHICASRGDPRPCRTASATLPGSESRRFYVLGARLAAREAGTEHDQTICECELVSRGQLLASLKARPTTSLDDIRRALRLAMGPCQGGFCIYRATGLMHAAGNVDTSAATAALLEFLQERWKGVMPLLHGDQLRQARLDDWIFQGILDVAHLPPEPAVA